MKTATRALIAIMLVSFIGCDVPSVKLPATRGAKPWTHENFKNNPRNFQFAIVSDRTGGHRPGIFAQAVGKLNLLQPEFVMCVGDLIEGYTENSKIMDAQWEEFNAIVADLEMPFFHVSGNHDISNAAMAKKWEQCHGSPWYHFVYNDTLFLSLCNVDGGRIGYIGDEQLKYIDKALNQNPNVRWTFIFMHIPLWAAREGTSLDDSHWADVEEMLRGRQYTVFAGHHHIYKKIKRNGMDYIMLATTGGASDLVKPTKMDHFVWVTMTDEGPRITNLLLDGVFSANIISDMTEMEVRRNPPVNIDTVLIGEQLFSRGKSRIIVRNPAPAPMKFSADIKKAGKLDIKPGKLEVTVPPGGTKVIELDITSPQPVDVSKLAPIAVAWKLSIDMPDGGKIDSSGTDRIRIEKGTLVTDGFHDDFSDGAARWRPINGKWEVHDGEYHHTLKSGYDYCTAADAWVTGDYTIQTKFRLVEGSMESGVMFNLPTRSAKVACQMIRFSGPGTIWHGYFDKNGVFVLEGSAASGIKGDGKEWITLAVTVHNSRGTYDILVNGKPVARNLRLRYAARSDEPRCGLALISCQGHVAYDDLKLTRQNPAK